MLRLALENGWLVALPFLGWFLWRAWARRTGREMGATPWPWLFAGGALLFGASLMLSVAFRPDNRDQTYVPAEIGPHGEVTPGRFSPERPPR